MAYTAQQATDAIAALDLDNLTSSQIENELKSIISQLSMEQKAEYGVSCSRSHSPEWECILYVNIPNTIKSIYRWQKGIKYAPQGHFLHWSGRIPTLSMGTKGIP